MSTDPLLRAIARGDPNCPDGANLARLGELTRRAGGVPGHRDLRAGVAAALDATPADDQDDAVDAQVEGSAADPALARLRELVRAQRPRRADLRERVRRAIAPASIRLTPQQASATSRRWRIVAAIAAAHVAAFLLFTTISDQSDPSGNGSGGTIANRAVHRDPVTVATAAKAATWDELRSGGGDLLALRRDADVREAVRADAGLGGTAQAVAGCVNWLLTRQDPVSGRIGTAASGDRAVAVQALAALALLGEGGGDQTRLARARLALGPVAAAMAGSTPLSPAALGASALALVEGALVTGDGEVRLQARGALLRLARELPGRPGEGGLAGLGWLALEAAAAARIEVPRGSLDAARERIASPLPGERGDLGRIGLAAYARMISGQRNDADTRQQLARLAAVHPSADAGNRVDALGWFMAGLALREDGGPAWRSWTEGLSASLLPRIVPAGPGLARVDTGSVRFADGDDGDVLATATAVLALQAPYRYAPLSR